jgi:sugar phosphate isomerase/epimerase
VCTINNSLEDDVALYERLGVGRCGLMASKLEDCGWERGVAMVRNAGLEIPYVVHGIFTPVTDTERWRREQDLMLHAIDVAVQVGARCLYFNVGPSGGLLWEQAATEFLDRMQPVTRAAGTAGVALAVENGHTSRPELGFVHGVSDALVLARLLGPKAGVCVDLYCCWLERGLFNTIRESLPLVHLVQVSDFLIGDRTQPERRVPGDGDLPLRSLLEGLLETGYGGTVDLELLGPAVEKEGYESSVARGANWLSSCLTELLAAVPSRNLYLREPIYDNIRETKR